MLFLVVRIITVFPILQVKKLSLGEVTALSKIIRVQQLKGPELELRDACAPPQSQDFLPLTLVTLKHNSVLKLQSSDFIGAHTRDLILTFKIIETHFYKEYHSYFDIGIDIKVSKIQIFQT